MNRLYEPWFRAWLILAPIIGLGSYFLMRNSWRRIRDIMQGNAGSVWDAPSVPDVAEPPSFVLYAIAATVLLRFLRDVQLKQNPGLEAGVFAALINFSEQPMAVHGMNEVGVADGLFDLIGLQVADVVPTDLLPVKMLGFCIHLLDPVFPKVDLAGIQRLLEEFNGLGFTHGDKLNMCR